jgi:hypothetical protein
MLRPLRSLLPLLLLSCASSSSATSASPAKSSAEPATTGNGATASVKTVTPTAAAANPASAERPEAIFERVKPELVKCYEDGRKAVPTMLDGKLTLNASIDRAGKTSCVIPTDDTGLTQEVEDCMSSKLLAAKVGDASTPIVSIPVAVRGGSVGLGERASGSFGIESVETHRMPDAFEVIENVLPEIQVCVREQDRSSGVSSVVVGARVGTDGRTQCALATATSGALTRKVGDCAANTLRAAKFPPPKGGTGLVLVPIRLSRGS